MAPAQRALRIVTADSGFHTTTRAAAEGIDGWQVEGPFDLEQIQAMEPGGVLLVDSELPGANIYECCRRLTSRGGARLLLVLNDASPEAEGIAVDFEDERDLSVEERAWRAEQERHEKLQRVCESRDELNRLPIVNERR